MRATTAPRVTGPRPAPKGREPKTATRVAVSVLGALLGLAGIEHGIGEILQGPARPEGLFILSWPEASAVEILSGEPAMTVIPNLLVTGILAVAVALVVVIWSIWFVGSPHGGLVLIALSVLLLLVGGGFGPPLMGVIVGVAATRIGASSARPPGRLARVIGMGWPWILTAAVLGYLALMPGMVLASHFLGMADAALVAALTAFAFTALVVALVAARAHDRARLQTS